MTRNCFLAIAAAVIALACPPPAAAQSEGIVSVGGSVTLVSPSDNDVENALSVGPLVRLNPQKGLGVALALNWFKANLKDPAGGDADFARLRVRPLMAGIGYTVGAGRRSLVNFSVVAGPSFNSVDFEDDFRNRTAGSPAIDAGTSFAIRPGISLTQTVAPRVGITAFAGYIFNRPDVTYRDAAGQQFANRWRGDAVVLSVGAVYSLF